MILLLGYDEQTCEFEMLSIFFSLWWSTEFWSFCNDDICLCSAYIAWQFACYSSRIICTFEHPHQWLMGGLDTLEHTILLCKSGIMDSSELWGFFPLAQLAIKYSKVRIQDWNLNAFTFTQQLFSLLMSISSWGKKANSKFIKSFCLRLWKRENLIHFSFAS